ncbi:unnamed protein product [Sympodiomycopsis kandeliae]
MRYFLPTCLQTEGFPLFAVESTQRETPHSPAQGGFIVPAQKEQRTALNAQDEAYIQKWAKKAKAAVDKSARQHPEMQHTLTREEMVEMAKEVFVGNKEYQDPSGVKLPLNLAAIDRLDSSKGYSRMSTPEPRLKRY